MCIGKWGGRWRARCRNSNDSYTNIVQLLCLLTSSIDESYRMHSLVPCAHNLYTSACYYSRSRYEVGSDSDN